MDCPICNGNGEIEYPDFHFNSIMSLEKEVSEGRQCFGSSVNTCFRCSGNGYLEVNE